MPGNKTSYIRAKYAGIKRVRKNMDGKGAGGGGVGATGEENGCYSANSRSRSTNPIIGSGNATKNKLA